MPRPAKKPKETLPPKTFTAKLIPAYAVRVKELPHLTFYGRTEEDARRCILSELTRQSPQGFSVDWPYDS